MASDGLSETQESARRIGICLNDYEQFWWNADANPICPACSLDDEDYDKQHQFFIAEETVIVCE